MQRLLFLLFLSFSLVLSACPQNTDPSDDDDATGDDDDATGDDDDATGDDDDATGDDDDATGDDDDATGDDDDATGDDDDATGDDDDATGDDDDSAGDDDDSAGDDDDSAGDDDDSAGDDDDSVGDDDDSAPIDGDGDGSPSGTDCDDADPNNYPGNTEVCDGQDNDCDATTVFAGEDTDGDTDGVITCEDCDDADGANFPGNTEVCDGQDNDCDATTVFTGEDTDGDSDGSVTCLDCDDADGANYPGNAEICDGGDNDCDATTVFAGEDTDGDSDGDPTCSDCDDADAANYNGNTESCDGFDNDCNGLADAAGGETDGDSDGELGCVDCDDADPNNFFGNTEICDGQDNDCVGGADFDAAGEVDGDSDGSLSCEDCDDNDPNATPGAAEICDGIDTDCGGQVAATWAANLGANPFNGTNRLRTNIFEATSNALVTSWSHTLDAPAGAVITFALYEGAAATGPFLPVAINDVVVPAALANTPNAISSGGVGYELQAGSFYAFAVHWVDDIGYFTDGTTVTDPAWGTWVSSEAVEPAAVLPAQLDSANLLAATGQYSATIVTDDEGDGDSDSSLACIDCDDADGNNFPGNTEVCDGFDNDCVAGPNFDLAGEIDFDADSSLSCADCDDTDATVFPGNTEICDGLDNDCDATTEAGDGETDDDADGFINCDDCADLDATVNPAASELCDGIDNNCNAAVPGFYATAATNSSGSAADRMRGNIFEVTADTLLTSFTQELTAAEGDELTWAVYQGSSTSGTFTLLDAHKTTVTAVNGGSAVFHESLAFGLPLEAGQFYALVTHWDATADYGWATSPGYPIALTWGNHTGSMVVSNAGVPTSASSANTANSYPMVVYTDDETDFDADTVLACADCDDTDASVAPGLPEECDGIDNNCSGEYDVFDLNLSDAPALAIPSSGTVTAQIDVPDSGVIGDLVVSVDITHTWDEDLDISLISPIGTTIDLSSDNGGQGDDYTNTTFDDDAATSITAGTAPFTGTFQPEQPLSTFYGEDPAGLWTLQIVDDTAGDSGTLNGWSLEIGLDPGAGVGFSDACAAQDCDSILTADPLSADGIYWIDPMGFGSFETFCDQTNDGGGWTLVANVDDINDPFFGGNATPYQTAWIDAWESPNTRNMGLIPTFASDIASSAKYYSFSEIAATDVRIAYKNDGAYFLCEGLDTVDTLDAIFSTVPAQDDCASVCTTWSQDRFVQSGQIPTGQAGLNCSDGNQAWFDTAPSAENARVGARLDSTVYSAFLGGMGDRGYSTSTYEKTWGSYTEGVVTDDNIMLFVR